MRRAALAAGLAGLAAAPTAHAVTGAAEEGGPDFVVSVLQGGRFACSGVLYAPDRVVTAGHCVDALPPGDAGGLAVVAGGAPSAVERATLHPDHFAAAEADVAVLWLAAPVAVEPALLRVEPPDEDWDGWTLRVAGWGASAPGGDGGGSLRSFPAAVEDVTESSLRFDGGDAFACAGDSGGAVLRAEGEGVELVGVVLGGAPDCDGPGGALRVDVVADFLLDPEGALPGSRPFGDDEDGTGDAGVGASELALDPGLPAPTAVGAACAQTGRTHPTAALLAAAALALGGRRRR